MKQAPVAKAVITRLPEVDQRVRKIESKKVDALLQAASTDDEVTKYTGISATVEHEDLLTRRQELLYQRLNLVGSKAPLAKLVVPEVMNQTTHFDYMMQEMVGTLV